MGPGQSREYLPGLPRLVANDFFNNTSYGNDADFNMLGIDASGAAINLGNLRNNIAYTGTLVSNVSGAN